VDEVTCGVAESGVVGVIQGHHKSDRMVGLRADMDALPIPETTGVPYASQTPGMMHACGHDGHTAMLLGAARYLCEHRDFAGQIVLVFQPAEEAGAGGEAMLNDGLLERWPMQQIYALHNQPGIPVGRYAIREGAMLASSDMFDISVTGKGGHAAAPQTSIDSIVTAATIISAGQSIVARNLSPFASAALSFTQINAGDSYITIPEQAAISGTIRALDEGVRALVKARLEQVVSSAADLYDAKAEITFLGGYPVLCNHLEQTIQATQVACSIVGDSHVDPSCAPILASEDFAFMLNKIPGAYIFIGNGDTKSLHNSGYDFNDAAIPYGCAFLTQIALLES
jgi:hippurate hydrolase